MKFRLAVIVALIVVVIGGGSFAGWYFILRAAKLDFDALGGTILVYEIAPDADKDWPGPNLAETMAEALQRRLDPDDRGFAAVKAVGKDRIEIRIPKTDDPGAMERIKDLVSKKGSLEFRILANVHDDVAAVGTRETEGEARHAINLASINSDIMKELEDAQQKGLPPPPPRELRPGELKPKRYEIVTANNIKSVVTYSWVELGPQERKALNLDNAAKDDASRNTAWLAAQKGRNKAVQLPWKADSPNLNENPNFDDSPNRWLLQGALFYNRECKDRNLSEEERRKKEVDYFVLTRDPEFESLTSEVRTPKIDGSYLVSAYGVAGADQRPAVQFSFNTAGGNLFGSLTKKNISETEEGPRGLQKRRHLAIILDGMVLSAPSINSEIRTRRQISGNFTQQEVDQIADILRSGALPTTLKPLPVSETEVPPKTK